MTLLAAIKDLPLVRSLRKARFARNFGRASGIGTYRGVYPTFAAARDAAPPSLPVGFDGDGPAAMYDERQEQIYSSDYPVLFWLRPLIDAGASVLDFGGHVGIAYYAYRRYLALGSGRWTVYDVPAVVRRGRVLAANRGVNLAFSDAVETAGASEVLLAAGSLQFVEEEIEAVIGRMTSKPKHVIVNKMPMTDDEAYVTLQSIGSAVCPYKVANRVSFLAPLEALGYEVVDRWKNLDLSCSVAFEQGRTVSAYTGIYLRLRGDA
jgi:putative methyltransferase (TIGR04325 family)